VARRALCLHISLEALAVLERRQLRLARVGDGPAGCPRLRVVGSALQCLERALDALVALLVESRELVRRAVTRLGMDRFAVAPVDGNARSRAEGQRLAPQRALPADLPQRHQVVLPEVRHRLGSRAPLLQQPPPLPMAGGAWHRRRLARRR
jgi:hypothetical protein